jgi:hypothetical protein
MTEPGHAKPSARILASMASANCRPGNRNWCGAGLSLGDETLQSWK